MYIVLAEIVYLGFSSCVLARSLGCQLKDEDVGSLSNSLTPRNGKVIQHLPKIWVWLYVFVLRPAKREDSVCKVRGPLGRFQDFTRNRKYGNGKIPEQALFEIRFSLIFSCFPQKGGKRNRETACSPCLDCQEQRRKTEATN